MKIKILLFYISNLFFLFSYSSDTLFWHNIERSVRYMPDGEEIIIKNGQKRFNRALYGTHSEFRVEAGDLPEFALFLPHMGGNIKFGIIKGNRSKWVIDADSVIARYIPGCMHYIIYDNLLGENPLKIIVIPMSDTEGVVFKVDYSESENIKLLWVFGGANGKRFYRNGDIGADPESVFYLHPSYCIGDTFEIFNNRFELNYYDIRKKTQKVINGCFPKNSSALISDANKLENPLLISKSNGDTVPVIAVITDVNNNSEELYYAIFKPEEKEINASDLPEIYNDAEYKRRELAGRVKITTPDPYINTLGGVLIMAADGLWDGKSFMHGAIAWRMPLNGWRGASMANPLGWSDRAETHFRGYAEAQYLEPDSGPSVPDPKKGLARQQEKKGVSLFTKGYISRSPGKQNKPHHYDMNLVFIDQIIRHLDWTGDTSFLREIWPVIERHMEWEKRCFDGNNDGLYDAYCCIWASDALQYSGGGVAHSSAYNYFSNMKVAELAQLLGKDNKSYLDEAEKIKSAMNNILWISDLGKYGEYIDLLGNKRVHPSAGLWTYYHTIDSKVPDHFQAYQMMDNVFNDIPKIPVNANGIDQDDLYTVSTTNWLPYTWSINNVALAEVMHTALAYWQAGNSEEAFKLWKSALVESMYIGSSPGNIQQLSFYDAMRGELYRDFADPVAMVVRSLVEGLFGIHPDALNNKLNIAPGFPSGWDSASIKLPEIEINYIGTEKKDIYRIKQSFKKVLSLKLYVKAKNSDIEQVTVNGEPVNWKCNEESISLPSVEIDCGNSVFNNIEIIWNKNPIKNLKYDPDQVKNKKLVIKSNDLKITDVYDPQQIFTSYILGNRKYMATLDKKSGEHIFFIKTVQDKMEWWQPVEINIEEPVTISNTDDTILILTNNTNSKQTIDLDINYIQPESNLKIKIPSKSKSVINVSRDILHPGNNLIHVWSEDFNESYMFAMTDIKKDSFDFYPVDLSNSFNDYVTNIFKNDYLSPRSPYPTLQLPRNGVGNWCYNNIKPEIDDSGLRNLAKKSDMIELPSGIQIKTPGSEKNKNIIFTSLWDNYPDRISVELPDSGRHLYLLMAGTTNPMQSRFVNGMIEVIYKDGSKDSTELINPETWWPIEQDYYNDGYAFDINSVKPLRVHLKTGKITREFDDYISIKGFSNRIIDGGAATVIDLPIDPSKKLDKLVITSVANDVVIGLMAVTIIK